MRSQRCKGFKVFNGLEGLRVWRVLRVEGLANGRLGRPQEAIDVWPWGAGWLQDAPWQTAGLDPQDVAKGRLGRP